VSRSELRRQRRAKLAAQQVEHIVEEATARVVNRRRVPPDDPTPPPSSQEATPAQVKEMRDGKGMSWMAIGAALGLPGAKNGAGTARRLYAQANGGIVPRTHAPRKGTRPKPVTPGSVGTITDRKIQLVTQGHVIPRDMPDEEVEALLRGRTVVWAIDLARLTHTDPDTWGPEDKRWVEQEARVHPDDKWVFVGEEDREGNRLVRFREYLGRDQHGKLMAGPTRTVRVDAIFTIR